MVKDETVSLSKEPSYALELFFIIITNSFSTKTA